MSISIDVFDKDTTVVLKLKNEQRCKRCGITHEQTSGLVKSCTMDGWRMLMFRCSCRNSLVVHETNVILRAEEEALS